VHFGLKDACYETQIFCALPLSIAKTPDGSRSLTLAKGARHRHILTRSRFSFVDASLLLEALPSSRAGATMEGGLP
jgi:hypothetical protein